MLGRPYLIVAAMVGVIAIAGGSFGKGAEWGGTRATAKCQAEKLEAQAQEIVERAALQAAIDKRDAELQAKEAEVADAIVKVRTEYLPGKTVVKREVVERAVFRECRVGDGMRRTIDAALAGHPVPGAGAEPSRSLGVSG